MCVSCVCRKNSVSVLCVFIFLSPNFCKSVVCVYLLPCFAAKSLLPNFCECVVCACLSCVRNCVCVAKLLRLHFMFCMILFGNCFALVRPALVVLFVSRLLFITTISFMFFRFALVIFFYFVLRLFILACVCFFRVGCSFLSCLFCVSLFVWCWVFLRLFFLSLFF